MGGQVIAEDGIDEGGVDGCPVGSLLGLDEGCREG